MKTEKIGITKSSRHVIIILVILVVLVGINLSIGTILRGYFDHMFWNGDDPNYINIAYNFQKNNKLELSYISNLDFRDNVDSTYLLVPHVKQTEASKSPLYLVLLGSFYKLFSPVPKDMFFYGSLFSNLLSSIFVVIYFLFVEKKFNLKISLISSLIISFIPIIGTLSSRVLPPILFLIFAFLALFFIGTGKKNYLFLGIFTALAELSHPYGFILIFSCLIFFLIKREFKGALIAAVSWHIVMLPIFVRNYFSFGDIGWGMWLPFSTTFSKIISSMLNPHLVASHSEYYGEMVSHISSKFYSPFDVISGLYNQISSDYNMNYLVLFIIGISVFAFVKVEKLRKSYKYFIIPAMGVVYFIVYYIRNFYLELILIFVVPLFSCLMVYKFKKSYIVNPIPNLYFFTLVYSYLSLIAGFLLAEALQFPGSDTRIFLVPLFLLLPISLYEFEKFIQKLIPRILQLKLDHTSIFDLSDKFSLKMFHTKLTLTKNIPVIIIVIILIPISLQTSSQLLNPEQFPTLRGSNETSSDKHVNDWLLSNLGSNYQQPIASNNAAGLFLKTSFASAGLPPYDWGQVEFEKVLDYYNASYVVLFDTNTHSSVYYDMSKWTTKNFAYSSVYSYEDSHIIKATNLIDSADILKPVLYTEKAKKFERLGNETAATQIYNQIMNYTASYLIYEQFCDGLKQIKKYDLAITKCKQVLVNNPADLKALKNLDYVYRITNQTEKLPEVLVPEIRLYVLEKDYDDAISTYDDLISIYENKLGTPGTNTISLQKSLIDASLAKANLLSNIGKYDDADQAYQDVIRLDMFNKDAHEKRAELLEKMGDTSDAQRELDFANRLNSISPKS